MGKSTQGRGVSAQKVSQSRARRGQPVPSSPSAPRIEWECPNCHVRQSAEGGLPCGISPAGTKITVVFRLPQFKITLRCFHCCAEYQLQAKRVPMKGLNPWKMPPTPIKPKPSSQPLPGQRASGQGRPAQGWDPLPDEPLVTAPQAPPPVPENWPRPRGGNWKGRPAYVRTKLTPHHLDDP